VVTVYFAAGGLLTSVWVNVVQLSVKLGGFALALPFALGGVGGWSALAQVRPDDVAYWTFWRPEVPGVLYLALLVPPFIISPGLLQKIFGARDDRAVRIGVGLNACGLLLYAPVPVLLGIIARARFSALPAGDLALPMILMHGLPPLVGSIGLAAVFSAEVSAADAILFMLATSLSQDIYRRFVTPGATDRQVLSAARSAAVAGGTLGLALAIFSSSIIDALSVFYALLGVSLFVPVVAGLTTRRAGTPEALAAIAAGIAVDVTVRLATAGHGFGFVTPELCGLIAAGTGFAVVAVARTGRGTGK
jgi:SSS family solute:Na+ symporter